MLSHPMEVTGQRVAIRAEYQMACPAPPSPAAETTETDRSASNKLRMPSAMFSKLNPLYVCHVFHKPRGSYPRLLKPLKSPEVLGIAAEKVFPKCKP